MKNIGKKVIGAGVATLLVTSVASLNAGAATVTDYKSYAEAQYIVAGGALGDPLVDPLVDLLAEDEQGRADGTSGAISFVDTAAGTAETAPAPYFASGALNQLEPLTGPLGTFLGSLGTGVIGSFAKADKNSSQAASGLITNEGAINLQQADPAAPSNATLNLTGQGQPLEALNALANVSLDLGAAASSAKLTGTNPTKPAAGEAAELDYGITGGGLTVELNALATLDEALGDALDLLANLTIDGGLLGSVQVTGVQDVLTAVGNSTNNGVSINLLDDPATTDVNEAGLIEVDVPEVLKAAGLDINDLPRNTALLPTVINGLTTELDAFLANLVTNVTDSTQNLALVLTPPTLPGVPATPITIPLGDTLYSLLLQPLAAIVTQLTDALDAPLEAVGDALEDVVTALEDVVDVRVNVQHNGTNADADPGNYVAETAGVRTGTDGVFAITAVRVTLLTAAGGNGLLTLNLANSLVGPNSLNTFDDVNTVDAVNTPGNNVNAVNSQANLNGNGGLADKSVDTLPSTGASNLWPFWLLGLLLVALGAAAMINEKRRESALLA